ncbi:uncharacterized protein N7518_007380 [Penicillium psychrosexuale]|uniref:uncharacterized protein n=1 Tax=Penicillium psychrosexuale TaxID=1002107 RepID=UPI0025456071|nr:uncharacterized protein N7518_007380 [Penicillium psychrosexuale]KAJ5790369.1 hypothetical protein N7518_007380 [Penicillium psychrosexuale]
MSPNNPVRPDSIAMPSTQSRLLELPNEVLQDIACYLPNDRDVFHLSQSCKEMWNKVFGSDSSVWRYLFGKHYDIVPGKTSGELKIEYQIRAIVLGATIKFKEKEDDRQFLWMEVMQTMLEESLQLPIIPGSTSKTLQRIQEKLEKSLSAFALDPTITDHCRRTDYDIKQVYAYGEKLGKAYIDHKKLDLVKLLNLRNFWQRHLLNTSEFTFQESFSALPAEMKPKTRKELPIEESKLSSSWLGYYSCMHPISDLQDNERQSCADLETHGDGVEIMTLDLATSEEFWPKQCSKIMPLAKGRNIKRAYFDGKQRAYSGAHEAGNHVFGFTEEIAVTHGGFEGWMRICFIIAEADEGDEEKHSLLVMDGPGWIHGYEAVIIPGGRMMLGRWVDMKETGARGPFIFWDV